MTAKIRIPEWLAAPVEPDFEYDSFRVWRGANIQYIQEPEWLLEQCIQKGGMTLVYGEPGSGKSLVTIAWANILAGEAHRDWMGFDRRQKRKVLYVIGEGQRGISGRVAAWMESVGLSPDDDEEWPGVQWIDQAVTLWRQPGTELRQPQLDILQHVREERVEVVFLDTLATTFGGGNENQQQDMNTYLEMAQAIQAEGAAVVVVHHNAKRDNEPRGSTVLKGFVDTAIMTSATIENGAYISGKAEMKKQKDGQPWGRELKFKPYRTQSSLSLVEATDRRAPQENVMRSRILAVLADGPKTRTEMYKGVTGNNSAIGEAVKEMISEGILGGGEYGESIYVVTREDIETI